MSFLGCLVRTQSKHRTPEQTQNSQADSACKRGFILGIIYVIGYWYNYYGIDHDTLIL